MKTLTLKSCLWIAAVAAFGSAARAQPPAPGPEIQKLGYYVGTWKGEGEAKGGPFGPAGKLSSTTTCEWFAGGFQVVCRGEESGPTGKQTFLGIRAYDAAAKAYTEYGITSSGETVYTTGGTLVDNRRTFVVNTESEGKPLTLRYTEVQLSPTLFTFQTEVAIDNGAWTTMAEGRVTKVE